MRLYRPFKEIIAQLKGLHEVPRWVPVRVYAEFLGRSYVHKFKMLKAPHSAEHQWGLHSGWFHCHSGCSPHYGESLVPVNI